MSWNQYIDNLIAQSSDNCDKACIIGFDGSQWTTKDHPSNLNLSAQEIATITRILKNRNDPTEFQSNGITVEGTKYTFLRQQENMILGKKKDHGAVTFQLADKCIVIGHTKEGSQQGNVNKGVSTVATYLKEAGY
ncbi:profilin-like [Clytia hemisphaerica]